MADKVTVYTLDIRIPDSPSQRVMVKGKLLMGSSPKSSIHIEGHGLRSQHCSFKVHNGLLSIHSHSDKTEVEGQPLSPGKMFVIDKGDKIKVGEVEIVIRADKMDASDLESTDPTTITDIMAYKEQVEADAEKKKGNFFKNLLAKLRPRKKTKELKAPKVAKKARTVNLFTTPHMALRVYGFLTTLAVCYGLIYGVLPYFEALAPVKEYAFLARDHVLKYALPLIPKLQAMGPPVIQPYIPWIKKILELDLLWLIGGIYIAFDLLGAILLGMPVSYFVMGITTDENPLVSRIRAIIRIPLALITVPLIIPELPSLIKRRPLKDFILLNRYDSNKRSVIWTTFIVLFPVIIISSLLSPILLDMSVLEGPALLPVVVTKKEKTEIKNWNRSETFGLVFPVLDEFEKEIIMLPLADKKEMGMIIFDHRKKNGIILEKKSFKGLGPLKNTLEIGNPLYPVFYSELAKKQKEMTNIQYLELTRAIEDSLRISINHALDVAVNHGPFISGLINLRVSLKDIAKIKNVPEARVQRLGKTNYLLLTPKELGPTNEMVILPLTPADYYLSIKYKKTDQTLLFKVINNYLAHMKVEEKKISPSSYSVLDSLMQDGPINKSQLASIVSFYKPAITTYEFNKKAMVQINKSLEQTLKVLESRKSEGEKSLDPTIKALKKLIPKS